MPERRAVHPYGDRPPWDIGAPQPALAALAEDGALRGRVLDIGCGTGEHTLMAAAAGCDPTGVDIAADALEIAERKARERGLKARFLRLDAFRLATLGETFDTALDSLVLHAFDAADRAAYLRGVHGVLRPGGHLFVLAYSDGQAGIPHGMSRRDLEACFGDGWDLRSLEPVTCSSNARPDGVAAWLATCTRL
jgi:SAM-dependent methyltransferase